MPTIIVVDLSNVTIDGLSAGSVTNVLANHDPGVVLNPEAPDDSGFRSALQAALVARDDAIRVSHEAAIAALSEAHATERSASAAQQAEAITALQAEHAAELAVKVAELAQRDATITDQKTQIDALGGTELGQKLARDKQRQALVEQQAQLAAKLAEMDATP